MGPGDRRGPWGLRPPASPLPRQGASVPQELSTSVSPQACRLWAAPPAGAVAPQRAGPQPGNSLPLTDRAAPLYTAASLGLWKGGSPIPQRVFPSCSECAILTQNNTRFLDSKWKDFQVNSEPRTTRSL